MNKKIAGTAMVLIGGIYSGLAIAADAPAVTGSPITLSVGGEAKLETIFGGGICNTVATAADVMNGEFSTASSGAITTGLVAIGFAAGSTIGDVATMTFNVDPCGGASIKGPTFELGREITFGASGTLANGLGVSFDDKMDLGGSANGDDWELAFDGAFGKVLFRLGGSAAGDMLAGTDGAKPDVLGAKVVGGHVDKTSGVAGVNVTYYAPSMGGIDLAIGYNPGTADSDAGLILDDGAFQDTFSIGFGYSTAVGDMALSVGGGMENASRKTSDCDSLVTDLAVAEAATKTSVLINGLYGEAVCGDEAVSAIGGSLEMGNITLSGAYSNMDSDGADQTVNSIGLATSVGDFSYLVGYSTENLTYARKKAGTTSVEDDSQIIMGEAKTALGDGVDLTLSFSSSAVDAYSEKLGGGTNTAWRAGVVVTVGF